MRDINKEKLQTQPKLTALLACLQTGVDGILVGIETFLQPVHLMMAVKFSLDCTAYRTREQRLGR
jgi:hypothetical protein